MPEEEQDVNPEDNIEILEGEGAQARGERGEGRNRIGRRGEAGDGGAERVSELGSRYTYAQTYASLLTLLPTGRAS